MRKARVRCQHCGEIDSRSKHHQIFANAIVTRHILCCARLGCPICSGGEDAALAIIRREKVSL